MGNCIGKKSDAKNKRRTYVPSPPTIHKRFDKKRSLSLSSPSAAKRSSVLVSHVPDVKESDYLVQKNEECEEQIARCSVYSVGTTVSISNDPFILIHSPSTSLSIQLPIECDNVESNHTIIDLAHPVLVITNEHDSVMGQLFSRETDINDDQRVPSFTDEILLGNCSTNATLLSK